MTSHGSLTVPTEGQAEQRGRVAIVTVRPGCCDEVPESLCRQALGPGWRPSLGFPTWGKKEINLSSERTKQAVLRGLTQHAEQAESRKRVAKENKTPHGGMMQRFEGIPDTLLTLSPPPSFLPTPLSPSK